MDLIFPIRINFVPSYGHKMDIYTLFSLPEFTLVMQPSKLVKIFALYVQTWLRLNQKYKIIISLFIFLNPTRKVNVTRTRARASKLMIFL